MDYKFLLTENNGGIFTVKINKPSSLNALDSQVITELKDLFTKIDADNSVDVVILTGEGKAFVAGADIAEMSTLTADEGATFAKLGMDTFTIIEKLSKPVIAAINGFALGGGCEISLACDIRVASTKALLGQPEVGLGITPGFGGTQRLPRAIGMSKAKELIYTGKAIKAEEALQIGLVSKVVEPEALMEEVVALAKSIQKNSKLAVKYAKKAMNTGMQSDIDTAMEIEKAQFGLCFATQDQKEGMKAFLEKRKPEFKGE